MNRFLLSNARVGQGAIKQRARVNLRRQLGRSKSWLWTGKLGCGTVTRGILEHRAIRKCSYLTCSRKFNGCPGHGYLTKQYLGCFTLYSARGPTTAKGYSLVSHSEQPPREVPVCGVSDCSKTFSC